MSDTYIFINSPGKQSGRILVERLQIYILAASNFFTVCGQSSRQIPTVKSWHFLDEKLFFICRVSKLTAYMTEARFTMNDNIQKKTIKALLRQLGSINESVLILFQNRPATASACSHVDIVTIFVSENYQS